MGICASVLIAYGAIIMVAAAFTDHDQKMANQALDNAAYNRAIGDITIPPIPVVEPIKKSR